jgi:CHAD domain-containing protein
MAKAKDIAGLDCGMSAGAGLSLVLRSRLEEMCAFREAALFFDDPKGVHDMRVASRRLRSLVRDFSPYFRRSRKLRQAKDDLKKMAEALGSVRDEDVAIIELERLSAESGPEVAEGIVQLMDERRLKRARARATLEGALTEQALDELRKVFNAALEQGLRIPRNANRRGERGEDKKTVEGTSFRQAGRDVMLASLLELEELSASLYSPLKTRPLHKMRLAAKRLRYSLELFAPCWSSEPLGAFAKEIAKLQTSLGELHDCDLWIIETGASLRRDEMKPEGARVAERSAAIWLLNYFVRERGNHFCDALARWHDWEMTGFLSRLRDTF